MKTVNPKRSLTIELPPEFIRLCERCKISSEQTHLISSVQAHLIS